MSKKNQQEKKQSTKQSTKQSIVKNVLKRLTATMLVINILVISVVVYYAGSTMSSLQKEYILEIVSNISSTVETTMDGYFDTANVLSVNESLRTILKETDRQNPLSEDEHLDTVLSEMTSVVDAFGGSIVNISLVSVAEDTYVMSDGTFSVRDTLVDRDYYAAITKNETIITNPYVHSRNNVRVISVSAPIHDDKGGVLGCIVLDIPTSFVSSLITTFGSTGSSWVVDSNNEVLAHTNSEYIGQDYSAVGVSGAELEQELKATSGNLVTWDLNGTERTGSVGTIPHVNWKLVTGLDTTEYNESAYHLGIILISIQIASVAITLFMCAYTIFNQLKPLKELSIAAAEMSKGNLHHLITHEGEDEIGALAYNLKMTRRTLASYIDEIKEAMTSLGDGDFTRENEVHFLGDFEEIQTSIGSFTKLITGTLESLKTNVSQVTVGANNVAAGSQNLAQGSTEQSSSVSELNNLVTDVTDQIQTNTKNIKEINATAQSITKQLEVSNHDMDNMMIAMNDIQEKSAAITKIVKTIEDVAFQTNILALNAAVEAARAGTAGKGFAVVADEVRSLSTRTSEAVKNTSDLINNTVVAVDHGNQIAENTIESLKSVTRDISGFVITLDEIVEASNKQAAAVSQINTGISQISNVMHSNSAVSEESAATSVELSTQANVMKESIEQFKLR
ncbi:MAG: methyl-accepting chemotaxis protein [Bacillota bacterium]